jgi:hypothetical protein
MLFLGELVYKPTIKEISWGYKWAYFLEYHPMKVDLG